MLPIGTVLFNTEKKKVGTVVGYSYGGHYYDIDGDDSFYWFPTETKELSTEEEILFYKLKYG